MTKSTWAVAAMSSAGFPGMATMSAQAPGLSTPMSSRAEELRSDRRAGLQRPDRAQPGVDHRLELADAVAEREHAAVGPEGDLGVAGGHEPLGVEDRSVVAAELPDRLAGERAGSAARRGPPGSSAWSARCTRRRAVGHLDALLVDQVGVLEAAGAVADRPACTPPRRRCARRRASPVGARWSRRPPSRRRTRWGARDRRRR